MTTTETDPWAEPEAPADESPAEKPAEKESGDPPDDKPPEDKPEEAPKTAKKASPAPSEGKDGPKPGPPAKKAATAKKTAQSPPAKKAAAAPAESKPAKPRKLGSSLEDQVTYVTELVWGPEGTGKTTDGLRMTELASGKKQRVLLIDAEAGAKKQALKQRGVDVSRVDVWPTEEDGGPGALTFEGMFDLADDLREQAEFYIGWMWDSGTEITKRLLDNVTADARVKDAQLGKARGRFQVNLEDHGVASAMLRELLRKFRDLPMHGVITALERRDVDNDTGRVKYGPAMAPAMANDAAGLVDLVIYKTVDQLGDRSIRSGHSVPTTIRRAKDRYGVLPPKLADPYFDRIVQYVNGDLTRDSDPVQKEIREYAQTLAQAKLEAQQQKGKN